MMTMGCRAKGLACVDMRGVYACKFVRGGAKGMLMGVCEAVSSGVLVRYWCGCECKSGGMSDSALVHPYVDMSLRMSVRRLELGLRPVRG